VAEGSWVSFGGDQGRYGAAWVGVESCTGRSSAVAGAMAADGELCKAGTAAHAWLAQGPYIGGCRLLRDEETNGISPRYGGGLGRRARTRRGGEQIARQRRGARPA
jgi:hypothetical protein